MRIKRAVEKCLNCSRLIAVIFCLIWLFFVTRYLEIKPEYATRQYLKLFQESPKNNGIVRMSSYFGLKQPLSSSPKIKNTQQISYYFNFLQLSQNKNRIHCQSTLQLLLINANYKTVGDSYLSLYKELEKQNTLCRHSIHQLNRRRHLLMDSEIMIEHYAMEVAMTIELITTENAKDKLNIVTFQEGCAILLKALDILDSQIIGKVGSIVFINAYNPGLEILYEPPYRYIHKIQGNMWHNQKKMAVLNQTQLIFISTVNYWDSYLNKPQDEDKYKLLWNGKKLQNSLFLSTRFMKNIHLLLHERDYFSNGNLSTRIAKYLALGSNNIKKIQIIEYFFNYGQLYGKLDPELKQTKKKYCYQSKLSNLNKFTKIFSTPCLTINPMEKIKQKEFENNTALIVSYKKSYIFNNKFERIEPMFETLEHNYFMIQKMTNSLELTMINPNRSEINVEFHKPFGPISNPIPPQIRFSSGHNLFLNKTYKQYLAQRKLIKICPNNNQLIFPEHFHNIYPDSSLLTVLAIYTINNIIFNYTNIAQNIEQDCYPDYFTQIIIVPKELLINWYRQRNIVLFVLLCAYVRKQSLYKYFYFYLGLIVLIRYILFSEIMLMLNLLILSTAILIEKSMQVIIHLVKFIQEMLDLRYRMMMLIVILVLALLKMLNRTIAQMEQLSAWKVLFILLIFVVNKENMLILIMKLYFLAGVILYNHNDFFEIGIVLTWIYLSLHSSIQAAIQEKQRKIRQNQTRREQPRPPPGFLQTSLALLFLVLIDGPSHMHNTLLTIFIILKFLAYSWDLFKQNKNLI